MQRNPLKFQEYRRTTHRNSEEAEVIESIETFQIFIGGHNFKNRPSCGEKTRGIRKR